MTENELERPGALGVHLEELRSLFLDLREVPLTPQRVVDVSALSVPHTSHCGLTVIKGRRPRSLAVTGAVPQLVDQLQFAVGEGPCLEAAEENDLAHSPDLARDPRWPAFASACVEQTGIRSMFAVRILLGEGHRAALNFYADEVEAFGPTDFALGTLLSLYGRMAVEARLASDRAKHLELALQTNRQIGTAVGILMARDLLTSDEAFAQLVRASQHLNRKLRDVAGVVEETGTLPPVPPSRRGPDD